MYHHVNTAAYKNSRCVPFIFMAGLFEKADSLSVRRRNMESIPAFFALQAKHSLLPH